MKRKVVGLVEIPYDRFPDGKPKTFDAWALECGHHLRTGVTSARRPRPSYIDMAAPQERTCPKCKDEEAP